jgi:Tol biopolymer transport system component
VRSLDSLAARLLPGTEGANFPFWSPDSKSLAFFTPSKLMRVEIAGGAPVALCDAAYAPTSPIGGAWYRDGTILFPGTDGLFRVTASGGPPARVTQIDTGRQELAHGFPQFLPDGKRFLYFIQSTNENVQGVYLGLLDRPQKRELIVRTAYKALYQLPQLGGAGWLLWMRQQTLLAQPFDEHKAHLMGEQASIAESVAFSVVGSRAAFWASDGGVIVYRAGSGQRQSLVWISRDGKRLGEVGQPDDFSNVRLSRDGKRAAVRRTISANPDIWLLEFSRGAVTRATFDPKRDDYPVWSPDGLQVAFASDRSGAMQLYRKGTGGASGEVQLTSGGNPKYPTDWSPNGKYLLYTDIDPKTGPDVWALPLAGDNGGKPIPVAQGPFTERNGVFSPDGKWIAYDSYESSISAIYVQPFPPTGAKWMISNQGGLRPKWRGDGKELFFVGPVLDRIMAAGIRTAGAGIEADPPRALFTVFTPGIVDSPFDATADGQRFLVLQPPAAGPDPNSLTVLLNWQGGLKK